MVSVQAWPLITSLGLLPVGIDLVNRGRYVLAQQTLFDSWSCQIRPRSRPPVSHYERQVYGGKQAIRRRTSVLGFTSAYQLEDLGDGASAAAVTGVLHYKRPQ